MYHAHTHTYGMFVRCPVCARERVLMYTCLFLCHARVSAVTMSIESKFNTLWPNYNTLHVCVCLCMNMSVKGGMMGRLVGPAMRSAYIGQIIYGSFHFSAERTYFLSTRARHFVCVCVCFPPNRVLYIYIRLRM